MTSYQIDNVIFAAHCTVVLTLSGQWQWTLYYSVGFPCFSYHRLRLSVSLSILLMILAWKYSHG